MNQLLRKIAKKSIDVLCFFLLLPSYCRQKKAIAQKKINKILLINLQGIGDIIMTTPFLTALRNHFPKAQIDYLCYNNNGALLERDTRINKIIKKKGNDLLSMDFIKTLGTIRKQNYDLAINLFPAQHSALLTVLSKASYKLGNFYSIASASNNLHVPKGTKTWDIRKNAKSIAEQLELPDYEQTKLSLHMNTEILKKINKEIKDKKYIILNPHANWISKKWTVENWQELLQWLLTEKNYKKYKTVIMGTEQDKGYTKEILEAFQKNKRVENWCNKYSLQELPAVLKNAQLFITLDTGPMHIALAMKTKIIALFGVTDPDILVSGAKNIEIINSYYQCPKKFQFNHHNEPGDYEQICMKNISVEQVKKAVEKMLP